ncbi:MAG: hypothetical protein KA072_01885 [Thermoanaerobaculaceae bacterium]|nr:hypothetical protein [Thermoanaerobaculaceae bacterium]MDI9621623.1 hypothetical protein [Acidobacteriota bacterium]
MEGGDMDIKGSINSFLGARKPAERYASFDYCFNHFQRFREAGRISAIASKHNLETSCLHLAFYLASWGMLRGSTRLLQKSVRFLDPLVRWIASTDKPQWDIDANRYTPENITVLLEMKRQIVKALGEDARPSDTLVTKIMLGVFGCVPALDENVRKGCRKNGLRVATLCRLSLQRVGAFYDDHAHEIDKSRVPTLDFASGRPTSRLYTRAKMIDMFFFEEGLGTRAAEAHL